MNDSPVTTVTKPHRVSWRNQAWYMWRGLLITFIVSAVIASVLLLTQQLSSSLRLYDNQGNWLVVWYGALIALMAMIYILGVFGLSILWGRKRGTKTIIVLLLYQAAIYVTVLIIASLILGHHGSAVDYSNCPEC